MAAQRTAVQWIEAVVGYGYGKEAGTDTWRGCWRAHWQRPWMEQQCCWHGFAPAEYVSSSNGARKRVVFFCLVWQLLQQATSVAASNGSHYGTAGLWFWVWHGSRTTHVCGSLLVSANQHIVQAIVHAHQFWVKSRRQCGLQHNITHHQTQNISQWTVGYHQGITSGPVDCRVSPRASPSLGATMS